MKSAFGVDHGEIIKYSGAYGVNRIAVANIEKDKLKKRKAMKDGKKLPPEPVKHHQHVDSWFGSASPLKGVKKSFTSNSARLMAAAARGNEYAAAKVAAGAQGKKVAQQMRQAQQANVQVKGIRRMSPKVRAMQNKAKSHTVAANQAKASGYHAAQAAKGAVSRASAASFQKPGTPRLGSIAERRPEPSTTGGTLKLLGAGAGIGAAGGTAGYAYSQRKRTA
jgi:hypothetical protein